MSKFPKYLLLLLCLWLNTDVLCAPPKSLLILNFEIEDDLLTQGGPVDVAENERRLLLAHQEMRAAFASKEVFTLIDKSKVDALIDDTRRREALHLCNGCEIEIAREAGADYVMVGWVQKVSNLILNVNAAIKDVHTGTTLITRSVDLRGNTDPSWSKAVKRLAADLHARLKGEQL